MNDYYFVLVRDRKAGTDTAPVAVPSEAAAIRDFGQLFKKSDTVYAQYPADFELVCVGWIHRQDNGYWQIGCDSDRNKILARGSDYVQA